MLSRLKGSMECESRYMYTVGRLERNQGSGFVEIYTIKTYMVAQEISGTVSEALQD